MHKVGLEPTVSQVRIWNTDDLANLQNPAVGSRLSQNAARQRDPNPSQDASVE